MLKPALTIDEQIKLLQSRGMIIVDDSQARIFLLQNNYYRLNVYFHKFMDEPNHYPDGTMFEAITNVYENDQWFRNKLLFLLESIEIHVKTSIAYYLGLNYGSDCFYLENIYENKSYFHEVQRAFTSEINRESNKKNPVIIHHLEKYDGQFPIWVVVEFLTFSRISKYFSSLSRGDRTQIAKNEFNVDEYFFSNWLHSLSVLRNICAHFGHLYQRGLLVAPKIYRELNIDPQAIQTVFGLCVVMKYLVDSQKWLPFITAISDRSTQNLSFKLIDYGFPTNWQNYLLHP